MLGQCWPIVYEAGQHCQHRVNISCLLDILWIEPESRGPTLRTIDLFYINPLNALTTRWMNTSNIVCIHRAGEPRVVVINAAFHASSGFVSRSRRFERNKIASSLSTRKTQYSGEPLWPRGSVLGLKHPGFEFRILCLDGNVISPSSGGSQFSLYVHKSGIKPDSFHFMFVCIHKPRDLTCYTSHLPQWKPLPEVRV